jgi:DNA mismatch repair protein MutL
MHFEINKVAGKLRLQQVPAGTRHLPWIKWFEHVLSIEQRDTDDMTGSLLWNMEIPLADFADETAAQVWYWLEQQSEAKQWEYIAQFAKVRTLSEVLDVWGE